MVIYKEQRCANEIVETFYLTVTTVSEIIPFIMKAKLLLVLKHLVICDSADFGIDCSKEENGARSLDPSSCSSYFKCVNGRAYRHPYARGNYFDETTLNCDKARLVNCTRTVMISNSDVAINDYDERDSASLTMRNSTYFFNKVKRKNVFDAPSARNFQSPSSCTVPSLSFPPAQCPTPPLPLCLTQKPPPTPCYTPSPCCAPRPPSCSTPAPQCPTATTIPPCLTSRPPSCPTPTTPPPCSTPPSCSTLCPPVYSYFGKSRRKYYVVRNGKTKIMKCRLGQWFDQVTKICRDKSYFES